MDFTPTTTAARRGLVVTFNHYLSTNTEAAAFGERFLITRGFDVLGVKPRSNIWFNDITEPDVADAVAAIRGNGTIYTYGSSMGAYAAIYFAKAAGAHRAVAVSPQATIDRSIVPWETRWAEEVGRFAFQHQPIWETLSESTRYFIIYDRFHPFERRHVDLIAQSRPAQCVHIAIPNAGHTAFELFDEAGIISAVMAPFFEEAEPRAKLFRNIVRSARRQSFVYHFNLACRLIERGKAIRADRYARTARRLAKSERYQQWTAELPSDIGKPTLFDTASKVASYALHYLKAVAAYILPRRVRDVASISTKGAPDERDKILPDR